MIGVLLALLTAGAAAAQDCDAIRRIPDRLICANEGVRAADTAMTEAYRALRERSDAATRTRLLAAQRRWLALRERACETRQDGEDAARVPCLIAMTERRRAALAAARIDGELIPAADGGPALTVETRILGRGICTVVVRLPHLADGGPHAALLDDAVRRAVFDEEYARNSRCDARNRDFAYHDYDVSFAVTWHSARVLAIAFAAVSDPGNAHPVVTMKSVVLDLARGRRVALADLIDPARSLPALEQECRRQIEEELGEGVITNPSGFRRLLGDFRLWTVTPTAATISFPRYAIMSGVAPGGECTLPLEALRPHLRAGNPLWG